MNKSNPIRIVDLFSGAGGLSLGWMNIHSERGFQLLAAVDADSSLEEVIAWNFPGVKFLCHSYGDSFEKDEAKAVATKIGVGPGDVEVLLAAPPCQTFSAAGKRELHVDSRLVFHVCDFAKALHPYIVLIENVPEFSRVQDGRLLGRVRVRLAEAGYTTHIMNFSAASFGVPQLRMRCFTLAIRNDLKWPDQNDMLNHLRLADKQWSLTGGNCIFDAEQSCFLSAPRRPTTVSEAIDDLPSLSAGEGEQESVLTSSPNSKYQVVLREQQTCLYNHVAVQHSPEMIAAMTQLKSGETPQLMIDHPLRRKEYFRNAYARLNPDEPALTMTTQTQNPGSGRFTHYRDHRVITVREVARLQSFPDRFRFFGSQVVQRRHVGNAVPPLLAQAISSILLPIVDR